MGLLLLSGAAAEADALVFVDVKARVAESEKGYRYSYEVANSTVTSMPIIWFRVDLRHDPAEHPLAERPILEHYAKYPLEQSMVGEHDKNLDAVPRVYPVEKLFPTDQWNTFEGARKQPYTGRWSCGVRNCEEVIKPGQRLSGFDLAADEPAGIRGFAVTADAPRADDSEEFTGKTIAPVAPPEPFTREAWLQRMGSDAQEARRLGWIKSAEALDEATALLEGLRTAEGRRLRKAVRKVERFSLRQKEKGLFTDEADALVRLNALYLFNRLEKR